MVYPRRLNCLLAMESSNTIEDHLIQKQYDLSQEKEFIVSFVEECDSLIRDYGFLSSYEKDLPILKDLLSKLDQVAGFDNSRIHLAVLNMIKAIETEKDNDILKVEKYDAFLEYLSILRFCRDYLTSKEKN